MERIVFTDETESKTINAYEVKAIIIRNGASIIRVACGYRDTETFVFNELKRQVINVNNSQMDNLLQSTSGLQDLNTKICNYLANQKSGSVVDD